MACMADKEFEEKCALLVSQLAVTESREAWMRTWKGEKVWTSVKAGLHMTAARSTSDSDRVLGSSFIGFGSGLSAGSHDRNTLLCCSCRNAFDPDQTDSNDEADEGGIDSCAETF